MAQVRPITLGPPISALTPQKYRECIKSLHYVPPSKNPSSIAEIKLYFGKRTIVRVSREPKYVAKHELTILAKDYKKTEQEITDLLRSRKVEIRD